MNIVFMLVPPKIVALFRGISNKTNQAQQCFSLLANWAPCFIEWKKRHFVVKLWVFNKK